MSDENTKKLNFFNRVVMSIKDFDKYGILAAEKTRTAIAYLAILMFIFSLIVSCALTYKFGNSAQKAISYVEDNINEITYADDLLSINSRRRDKTCK